MLPCERTYLLQKLLRHHYEDVVVPHVQSGLVDERSLWAATSLAVLDDVYTVSVANCYKIDVNCFHLCFCRFFRKVAGSTNLDSFYNWCSCSNVMHKVCPYKVILLLGISGLNSFDLFQGGRPDALCERPGRSVGRAADV